jgi:hypothetical protein
MKFEIPEEEIHITVPKEFEWMIYTDDCELFCYQHWTFGFKFTETRAPRCRSGFEIFNLEDSGHLRYQRTIFVPDISDWCEEHFCGEYIISHNHRPAKCIHDGIDSKFTIVFNNQLDWLYFKMRW